MVKLLILLCLLLSSFCLWSKDKALVKVPAYFKIDQNDLQDIKLKEYDIHFLKDSLEWFRKDDHLLLPYALVKFKLKDSLKKATHFSYKKMTHYLKHSTQGDLSGTLHYSLYEPDAILVFQDDKLLKKIQVIPSKGLQIIDPRCQKYKIQVNSNSLPLSISCQLYPFGSHGKEQSKVDLYVTSPLMKENQEHKITYTESGEALVKLKEHEVKIKLKVPKRYHRLRTAIGFGPYAFKGQDGKPKKSKPALALMLYGAYQFNSDVSMKFFDAFITHNASFNNGGLYLSNNIAKLYDNQIIVNTLLGAQILSFSEKQSAPFFTESIYPQGLEATWYNAFGVDRFIFSAGMFLNLTTDFDYENAWLRWGKGYYWEINYINWKKDDRLASMWGLSLIFPFLSFF